MEFNPSPPCYKELLMKRAVIILLFLVAGIGLLSYPYVSNYLTEVNGSKAIQELRAQIEQEDDGSLARERALAEEYNASLTGQEIKDPFVPGSGIVLPENYGDILDYANNTMGYIEIPKIKVKLPIYHGVSDDVLVKGVGHMSETAFPIGGEGNHSVLTGHTALPSAKLFSDLIELTQGDTFYIDILNEILAYQVENIRVVEPDNTIHLAPVEGKDYITLLTCTPYAINTHRLLVQGTRIPYTPEQYEQEVQNRTITSGGSVVDTNMVIIGAIAGLIIIILIAIVYQFRRRKG